MSTRDHPDNVELSQHRTAAVTTHNHILKHHAHTHTHTACSNHKGCPEAIIVDVGAYPKAAATTVAVSGLHNKKFPGSKTMHTSVKTFSLEN